MDLTAALLHYGERAALPQWQHFNQALALELAAGLPEAEIRRLFLRIGQRMADGLPVPRCDDTRQLQQAFNAHWEALGWGVAVLELASETNHVFYSPSKNQLAVVTTVISQKWQRLDAYDNEYVAAPAKVLTASPASGQLAEQPSAPDRALKPATPPQAGR